MSEESTECYIEILPNVLGSLILVSPLSCVDLSIPLLHVLLDITF